MSGRGAVEGARRSGVVLAVEDEDDVRHVLSELLKQHGLDIHTAPDGTNGLQQLEHFVPDAILLDQSLPDMSGLLLLDVIRARSHLQHVPVILLTADATAETKITALGRGAVDYITKPFDSKDLVARIRAQIRRKDEEQEIRNRAACEAAEAQLSLKTAQQRFDALVKNSFDLVCELDSDLRIAYASPNLRSILQYETSELAEARWLDLVHPDDRLQAEKVLRSMLAHSCSTRMTVRFCDKAGEWRWLDVSGGIQNPTDSLPRMLLVSRDITQTKETEARLARLALHDPLTDLGNRQCFEERLASALADFTPGKSGGILRVDVDNFKLVNDTRGHQAGDEALRSVARVLQATFEGSHSIFREGGDEFCVLLSDVTAAEADALGNRLLRRFSEDPSGGVGQSLGITLSAGIAMIEEGITSEELLSRADFALYAAKRSGKNRCRLYQANSEELAHIRSAAEWIPRLRAALHSNGFKVLYQPIADLRTRVNLCHESLLRYMDEDGRMHSPEEFLPAAERYNLMAEIDRFVIGHVLEDLRRDGKMRASVNLSGQSIKEPGLGEFIVSALAESSVDPHRLMFEITETVFIFELQQAKQLVNLLRGKGCCIALDDFGSGFSSLNYLRQLPIDVVKIDGSFVEKVSGDPVELTLLRSMNEIARMLGKFTIAEYVGDETTCEKLVGIGVSYGQGYHLGRPMPIEQVLALDIARSPVESAA